MSDQTKIPYTFNIDPAPLAHLRELSEKTGVPVAEMIRRGIAMYLRQSQLVDAVVVWRAEEREP